jgi:hypothetical protein
LAALARDAKAKARAAVGSRRRREEYILGWGIIKLSEKAGDAGLAVRQVPRGGAIYSTMKASALREKPVPELPVT